MTAPDDLTTADSPDDLVIVEAHSRDDGWLRHFGLSYPGVTTRSIAEARIDIAHRIWRGGQYRIVPATVGAHASD